MHHLRLSMHQAPTEVFMGARNGRRPMGRRELRQVPDALQGTDG
ncbi:hypothetical protein [Segatella bryantii]|nr:hypothetical protein [Segatella bryantii]